MSQPASIAAVVVNHNAGAALVSCVESLRRGGLEEIVVVDNASHDGSLERLAAADASVVLLPLGENLGYGSAVNRALHATKAPYLLVCNPDLLLDEAAPAVLAGVLDGDDAIGAVGPRVLEPNGETYPSARSFPAPALALAHGLVGFFLSDNAWSRRYRMQDEAIEARDADWISGSCMLIRRAAFASVHGFDEGYFMYVEDLDLCWRLWRAGWRVRYEPSVAVVHAQGLSTSRRPYAMLLAHHRSTWRFARKATTGPARLFLPIIGLGIAARLAVSAAQTCAKHLGASSGAGGAAH